MWSEIIIRPFAQFFFYCDSHILATALQKFLEIRAVIPSKFLLCLAQSMKISGRKELCKRSILFQEYNLFERCLLFPNRERLQI